MNFIDYADSMTNLISNKNKDLFQKSIRKCIHKSFVNELNHSTRENNKSSSVDLDSITQFSRLFSVDESTIGLMAVSQISFYSLKTGLYLYNQFNGLTIMIFTKSTKY